MGYKKNKHYSKQMNFNKRFSCTICFKTLNSTLVLDEELKLTNPMHAQRPSCME